VCGQQVRALASAIDEAELARCKAQLKAHLFMGRESLPARAEQAAGQILLYDRLFTPAEIAGEIDAVGAEDMARIGARLLQPARTAGAVLGARSAMPAAEAFGQALFG
jgi:predicted Zn-dependent peptidase